MTKAATFRRLTRRTTTRSAGLGSGYVPPAPVLSGTFVTPQTALALAAVYAAINVISRDIAGLGAGLYFKSGEVLGDLDLNRQAHRLVSLSPNGEIDAFSFWQTSMSHVLGWGNAYAEIVRKDGFPTALHLLHPAKTKPRRTENGRLYYELDNKRTLQPYEVLHFSGMGFDGLVGYSPLTVCRQTIGLAIAAEQFGAAFFGNSAVPKGFLKTPKKLSEAAVNNLRRSFNQIHQGSQSAFQLGILEEGLDWVNTQINPEDGQWLGTREFQIKDIARMYSLPPHKVGDYSESHLANVEEANADYITTTLAGWVNTLVSQMNLKLLTLDEQDTHSFGFNFESLLRGNTAARMQKYQTMRNVGAMSADDIRIAERMRPLGRDRGGETYVVQAQYIPLDQLGKVPPPPTPTPTAAA